MKKVLNICSYALNIFFILMIIIGGSHSTSSEETLDSIKSTIIESEVANLPLKIQEFDDVTNIVIDSMVITNNIKPYTGYLVTKWNYNRQYYNRSAMRHEKKPIEEVVYVEVSGIQFNNSKVTWNSHWLSADLSLVKLEH